MLTELIMRNDFFLLRLNTKLKKEEKEKRIFLHEVRSNTENIDKEHQGQYFPYFTELKLRCARCSSVEHILSKLKYTNSFVKYVWNLFRKCVKYFFFKHSTQIRRFWKQMFFVVKQMVSDYELKVLSWFFTSKGFLWWYNQTWMHLVNGFETSVDIEYQDPIEQITQKYITQQMKFRIQISFWTIKRNQ